MHKQILINSLLNKSQMLKIELYYEMKNTN